MDPLLLRVFMNRVAFECDGFEHGAAGINEALKAKNTRLIFIHSLEPKAHSLRLAFGL